MDHQLTLSYASDDVSDLSISNAELELRSWNLFSVLLSIGHPVSPIELASRCRFVEASTEFVEFICSLPDSPLSLSSDGLVTVSDCVCRGLQRFLVNSSRVFELLLPREIMRKRGCEDVEIMYYRKRRRLRHNAFADKAGQLDLSLPWRIPNASAKVDIHDDDDDMLRNMIMNAGNHSVCLYNEGEREKSTILSMTELECMNRFLNNRCICFPSSSTTVAGRLEDFFQFRSSSLTASSHVRINDIKDESCLSPKKLCTRSSKAVDDDRVVLLVKDWIHNGSSGDNKNLLERQSLLEGKEYECILDSACHEFDIGNLTNNTVSSSMIPELNIRNINTLRCNGMPPSLSTREKAPCQKVDKQNIVTLTDAVKLCTDEVQFDNLRKKKKKNRGREDQLVCSQHVEQDSENLLPRMDMTRKVDCTGAEPNLMTSTREHISLDQKDLAESTDKLDIVLNDSKSITQAVLKTTKNGNVIGSNIEQKECRKDKRSVSIKQKLKPTCDQNMHTAEKRENVKEHKEKAPTISVKGHSEPKVVPTFDSYVVEEEEGSGGYGTVYKARRKEDGKTFAVKYPHVNANRHHVYNEVRMLERFGGKNFVIKFEGSFKSNNSHCLVLEHVAHDRPEVLKREINVSQLQWYGFCLFSALASLHKQGVIHRDVKPGNFLFSRKANKGYLIDFNLATDLHQKFGSTENSKAHHDARCGLVPPSHSESKSRKYTNSKALEAGTQTKFPKKLKKQIDQGADGSGITSTKDATSNRVPSGERFREPIPCTGRKQLLNLAHEAMQNRGLEAANTTPALKRKRVAATPTKLDNKFMYITPMPLQCSGGLLKNKGKQRKEGPCAGTKGFRAPEVLLKSTYQGPKVDIWSAGVTLLYLITGRTPFIGDPDQNIKEIAKLKGSEELWEVAKLHDRESSFPPELFQIQSLTSTSVLEWCKQNTRRPDFLEVIPRSLIDLVDKCLMVNPRLRISAEDALRHEFFGPCLKELEKLRLRRQRDSRTTHSNSQPVTCKGLL